MPEEVTHNHQPVYRIALASYNDPLDASYSRSRSDNRWNPPDSFDVLYTSCSERVARAVLRDRFRLTAARISDLSDERIPHLCEIEWDGPAVDVISAAGLLAAGLAEQYPVGVDKVVTQAKGAEWHKEGREAVVARSMSLVRLGIVDWSGDHAGWGELAIFVDNVGAKPVLRRRREDLEWLIDEPET